MLPARQSRFSLSRFAILLGLCGLGGAWSAAALFLSPANVVAGVMYVVAAFAWFGMTVVYVVLSVRRRSFVADINHTSSGPYAAYIPVIGLLLVVHYAPLNAAINGTIWIPVTLALMLLLALIAAWLFQRWVLGRVEIDDLHTGYMLPVTAGPFIASIALANVGLPSIATASFGVGLFFWVVVGSVVVGRLIGGAPVEPGALPSLAILMSPPAVGSLSILIATHGHGGVGLQLMIGVLVFMALVQVALIPAYRRAPITARYWSFMFPIGTSANFTIRLLAEYRPGAWRIDAICVLAAATLIFAAIALSTSVAALRRRHRHAAVEPLVASGSTLQ